MKIFTKRGCIRGGRMGINYNKGPEVSCERAVVLLSP